MTPPTEKPAITQPAIEARGSPAASSSSATNGNRPKITMPSTNTAEKQTFARGIGDTCRSRRKSPKGSGPRGFHPRRLAQRHDRDAERDHAERR
jgi:hypothetical protein